VSVDVPTALPADEGQARRIGAIRRDIMWLSERWDDLVQSRLKGTSRPWRQPVLTPEAREALDAQARIEKHERSAIASGEHPAPVHVDVLDVLEEILDRAHTLHEHVADTIGKPRLTKPRTIAGDITPHLAFIHAHLVTAVVADPDMLDAVGDVVAELREIAARQLGEMYDGQTLAGVCPFCHGKTPTHPTGGAHTLRVRMVRLERAKDPDYREPAIVCGNELCQPNEQQCGTWHHGRPAWPMLEWTWLANLLAETDVG